MTTMNRKLKVGFYVGLGGRNTGAMQWARFFRWSPQVELALIDAQDVRDGKLNGLDLFMVPGGDSEKQCLDLGDDGMAEVRRYVAAGGSYLGVCAGYHCALCRPNRIGLFPYTIIKGGHGDSAPVAMELNERGAEVIGVPAGNYVVTYAKGPIATPCVLPWDVECRAEELGHYRSTVARADHPEINFFGRPAILRADFGKGKVIATSFHPELRESTYPIAFGCVEAVTGVRITPEFPVSVGRPIRVGYFTPTVFGKRCPQEIFDLELEREFDVRLVNMIDVEQGIFHHLDVMIFSDGVEGGYEKNLKSQHVEMIRAFLERGGKVLASGNGENCVPEHPNRRLLPVGEPFAAAVLASQVSR